MAQWHVLCPHRNKFRHLCFLVYFMKKALHKSIDSKRNQEKFQFATNTKIPFCKTKLPSTTPTPAPDSASSAHARLPLTLLPVPSARAPAAECSRLAALRFPCSFLLLLLLLRLQLMKTSARCAAQLLSCRIKPRKFCG